jgi:hypothetical protein
MSADVSEAVIDAQTERPLAAARIEPVNSLISTGDLPKGARLTKPYRRDELATIVCDAFGA